ncbi:hypothetical protein TM102_17470 [Bradyrhizobium sp. TM102]|nr:hypothetical protein TM102_17470 [Bradyrhizobium sp. TM102]
MTLAALTALSAGAAALGASCGLSFSGISDPRSNEQPHNAIPMSASANGGCEIRRSHVKPCWGRGEAIYGSLALEHDPDPKGRVGEKYAAVFPRDKRAMRLRRDCSNNKLKRDDVQSKSHRACVPHPWCRPGKGPAHKQ